MAPTTTATTAAATDSGLENYYGTGRKVGVGYHMTGEERALLYDDGEIEVRMGDIVVFNDPDAGAHAGGCELISQSTMVGFVQGVYAVDYSFRDSDGFELELDTTLPAGRLALPDAYVGLLGENYESTISHLGDSGTRQYADILLNSEFDRYYGEEWHIGRDGVDDDTWEAFSGNGRSAAGCPYCTGEKGEDGMRRFGE